MPNHVKIIGWNSRLSVVSGTKLLYMFGVAKLAAVPSGHARRKRRSETRGEHGSRAVAGAACYGRLERARKPGCAEARDALERAVLEEERAAAGARLEVLVCKAPAPGRAAPLSENSQLLWRRSRAAATGSRLRRPRATSQFLLLVAPHLRYGAATWGPRALSGDHACALRRLQTDGARMVLGAADCAPKLMVLWEAQLMCFDDVVKTECVAMVSAAATAEEGDWIRRCEGSAWWELGTAHAREIGLDATPARVGTRRKYS